MRPALPACLALLVAAATAAAHDDPEHDLPAATVEIRTTGDFRVITSNGLPDHPPGDFPTRGNPNAIRPQRHHCRVPLHPRARPQPTPIRGVVGVALNGVPFDPGTAEFWSPSGRTHDRSSGWNYDALSGRINLGIDDHHAHVQPSGAYHYHGLPTGLIRRLEQARDSDRPAMTLIGYAADGFPIYAEQGHADPDDPTSALVKLRPGYRLKAGQRPTGGPPGPHDGTFVQDWEYVDGAGDLDACNGRTGVTPEYPDGTYYYVINDSFPFVPRCLRGTPDPSFQRRPGPGDERLRRPRSDGRRGRQRP